MKGVSCPMKFRDKSTTILVFTAFLLSFIVLWNISDLVTKIENQKHGSGTYKNIRNINVDFEKVSEMKEMIEDGNEEPARNYSRKMIEGLLEQMENLPECNISVTSMRALIGHSPLNPEVEIILKKNEELPYDVREIYDESGQIFIGESLEKYLTDDKSITLDDESYSVKGILKNYGMGGQDERVIMLYESLSPEQKSSLIKQIEEKYFGFYASIGITICLGSSNAGSVENSYTALSDYLDEIDDAAVMSVPISNFAGEQNAWYQLSHTVFETVSIVFAVINGIVVSNLWYQRRRREFLIRRIFGYGRGRIWLLIWKEMGKIALSSLACSAFIWILYMFAKGSKIQWNLIGLQCFIMACGTVLVIFVTTICPYKKTMAVEPAEGLGGYRAG